MASEIASHRGNPFTDGSLIYLFSEPRTAEETIRKGASNILTGKGGVYIPPGRLEEFLKEQETDKSSESYQRFAWEALKKSINGLVNKHVVQELFRENLVRGRGVLAQFIIRAQNNSPIFTQVYAALVAVINTKVVVCLFSSQELVSWFYVG
ncbi:Pre-mRNA-splicing factor CWC22 [Thelohanellus kitauei]|uniref:Pre-mRNA-splicing factor CWC22 n=1 Tax=Thelohanellus kitauei TaxID=669202 RepID=A0A0C2MVN1_THEKT|nr:Pre-mRNA-splicing factor CWC22 [Thelohanellus kitauei]